MHSMQPAHHTSLTCLGSEHFPQLVQISVTHFDTRDKTQFCGKQMYVDSEHTKIQNGHNQYKTPNLVTVNRRKISTSQMKLSLRRSDVRNEGMQTLNKFGGCSSECTVDRKLSG